MEIGEIKNEKVYQSPRQPPKISLTHDRMKELVSEVLPDKQKPTNQTNQTLIQIMIEGEDPL